MSAFLCNPLHFKFLVHAGVSLGVIEAGWEDVAGELLLVANHESLGARYGDDQTHETYKHEGFTCYVDPVQVLAAAGCLEYLAAYVNDLHTARCNLPRLLSNEEPET